MFDIFKKNLNRADAADIAFEVAIRIIRKKLDSKSYVLLADELVHSEVKKYEYIGDKNYKISNDEALAISKVALFLALNHTEELSSENRRRIEESKEFASGKKPNYGLRPMEMKYRICGTISDQLLIFKD
tara:strand:+ start:149 stop:538 length:390 start_codon:yes stop_codon:yes gene_type:complete